MWNVKGNQQSCPEKYPTPYVLDTNILLEAKKYPEDWGTPQIPLLAAYVTLEELDNLKTAPGLTGWQARRAVGRLAEGVPAVYIQSYDESKRHSSWSADDTILEYAQKMGGTLVTLDLLMSLKAKLRNIPVLEPQLLRDLLCPTYSGGSSLRQVSLSSYNLAQYWGESSEECQEQFVEDLLEEDGGLTHNGCFVEVLEVGEGHRIWERQDGRWTNISEEVYTTPPLRCSYLSPEKVGGRNIQQKIGIWGLRERPFVCFTGKAGSGKTLLAMSYLLGEVERGKLNKVYVVSNPVKVRGAQDMGAYKGGRNEKLLQNSLGSMLNTKLGRDMVDSLLQQEVLELLPMGDIRGMEIRKGEALYITEAQNTSRYLMKTAIERVAEGARIVVEGDLGTQCDKGLFEDGNNGLLAVVETFRGEPYFLHMEMEKVLRSPYAEKAQEMWEA